MYIYGRDMYRWVLVPTEARRECQSPEAGLTSCWRLPCVDPAQEQSTLTVKHLSSPTNCPLLRWIFFMMPSFIINNTGYLTLNLWSMNGWPITVCDILHQGSVEQTLRSLGSSDIQSQASSHVPISFLQARGVWGLTLPPCPASSECLV